MAFPREFSRAMARHLEKECALYERYIKVLNEQRETVTEFNTEKLRELDKQRALYSKQMQEFHEQRISLMSQLPNSEGQKLRVFVEQQASKEQKKVLSPLAEKLKALIEKTRKATLEFQMVQTFALNMVNGSISLLTRARKHVSKQYGKEGTINESYVPRQSRKEGVIKEA